MSRLGLFDHPWPVAVQLHLMVLLSEPPLALKDKPHQMLLLSLVLA